MTTTTTDAAILANLAKINEQMRLRIEASSRTLARLNANKHKRLAK